MAKDPISSSSAWGCRGEEGRGAQHWDPKMPHPYPSHPWSPVREASPGRLVSPEGCPSLLAHGRSILCPQEWGRTRGAFSVPCRSNHLSGRELLSAGQPPRTECAP